jgi:zinc-binding alcohol dehydrogenase/oxidoreductase
VRAIQLLAAGEPPRLELMEVPAPSPRRGQVVVAVRAAALNRRDAWVVRQTDAWSLPATPGSDAAGVVQRIGAGVSGVRVGDDVVVDPTIGWGKREDTAGAGFEILGLPTPGTFAELVVVPAENVRPKPERLTWEEAATLGLAGLTAWRAAVTCAGAAPGRTILVAGAGGGVGGFAIQIAAARGARVLGVSSGDEKRRRACELGAAACFDGRDPVWPRAVRQASDGGVDAALDPVGPGIWPRLLDALKPGGVLVSFGVAGGSVAEVDAFPIFWHWRRIVGTSMGSPREFDQLVEHVGRADWRPTIDSVFPLQEFGAALARLDAPDRFGKVCVRVDPAADAVGTSAAGG